MKNPKSDKRAAVMEAALEVIAENGLHNCPTALIAERANVGSGTIYRYFASKDELILQIYFDMDARVCEMIFRDHPKDAGARERFLDFAGSFLRYLVSHPRDFSFLQQFYNSPYGAELWRKRHEDTAGIGIELLTEILQKGEGEGVLKEVPLLLLIALGTSPLFAVARDVLDRFLEFDDTLVAAALQGCWDAMRK